MDWTASGIKNEFEIEKVGFDLESSYGFIDITDGTISDNYDGDYRTSASLELEEELDYDCLYRIWHVATLKNQTERFELGTYMLESQALTWEKGKSTSSASLQSTLYGMGTALRHNDRAVKDTQYICKLFSSIVTNGFAVPYIDTALTDRTFGSAHVWEFGDSLLSELQVCADSINGIIQVDTHGRICLNKYTKPSKRPKSWTLDGNCYVDGISIDSPEVINKVVLTYTYEDSKGNEKTIYSLAMADETHPWYRKRIGRDAVDTYDVDSLSKDTQSALDSLAKTKLNSVVDTARSFEITMPYMPLETGEAGYLVWGDEVTPAVIAERSINLNNAMEMKLTVEELT